MMNKAYKILCYILCSWFGTGFCPVASGTAGSFATLPLAFIMAYFFGFWGILAATVICFFVGVIASKEVLKYTKHDPSLIVIDETAGQLLSFVLVANALEGNLHAWWTYLLGFALFRLFDITKPQPAKYFDSKVLNAWGVMLDDIAAGVYAAILLYVAAQYLPIL